MKHCCSQTFIKALEEVVYTIKVRQPESMEQLEKALNYAISLLKRTEEDRNQTNTSQV